MRKTTIQTGPGKIRTIYIVSGREKRAYVRLARKLAVFERELAERHGVAHVAHGFVAARSPVTMAQAHVGYDVTISLDLANWFESVTQSQLEAAGVPTAQAWRCCPGGVVRQGLPTSPAAANIAGVLLDKAVVGQLISRNGARVYTRYADDLTFSWCAGVDTPALQLFVQDVAHVVSIFGWRLNESKTHIQFASAGRRIICGLSVGATDVRSTKAVRHRLRACQHKRPSSPETRGLAEWAACKLPGSRAERAPSNRVIQRDE